MLRINGFAAIALTTLASFAAASAGAQEVGRMTAVQTSVERNGNPLSVGAGIALGDALASNATGLGMIVFVDQSSAKIGPNSRLVIDDFVYGGGSGTSGVRMDRGITRFYGGRISKKGTMQITTPHVVLAVRGGIVDVAVSGGSSVATLRAGKLTCRSNGVTKVITKPGFSCVSNGAGLGTARNSVDFSILDSTAAIAGTDQPGSAGPGPDASAPCTRNASDRMDRCRSRDGQLPGLFQSPGNGSVPPQIGIHVPNVVNPGPAPNPNPFPIPNPNPNNPNGP